MTMDRKKIPEHIYSIDVLRGIAALCVVFWHWQHFFFIDGKLSGDFIISNQPFYEVFYFLYNYGHLAVQLFFSISGFIFFWLYSTKISERKISTYKFSIDRFSRLYPLHLFTFIVVFLLQELYLNKNGFYFVYQNNDLYHAILNLLLIPAWGFQHGWSFNAPIWSVSIEVLLYMVFFIVCIINVNRILASTLLIFLSFYLTPLNSNIATGLMTFFCGGLTFIMFKAFTSVVNKNILLIASVLFFIVSWYLPLYFIDFKKNIISCISFPMTILLLSVISFYKKDFLKSFSFIGDLSYSSYLIHFPLQIAFIIISQHLGYNENIYYSPWILLLFIITLLPLSFLSHRFLEMPMQRHIRQVWGG